MQVISLSGQFCGFIVRNAANGGSGRVYILSITVVNITLKYYLWAVLIIELLLFIVSVVAIQRKAEESLGRSWPLSLFLLTFFGKEKKVKNHSSTLLLKEADFQLTLLPKLMRLVIN